MKGGIYTKERCPVCNGKFIGTQNDLVCPVHQTSPRRYYVVLYSRELGKHMKLYSDSRGIPFSSYEQADRILTKIRAEIDAGSFDPSRYVPMKLKPLQFTNYAEKWLGEREAEVEGKQKVMISSGNQDSTLRIVSLSIDRGMNPCNG